MKSPPHHLSIQKLLDLFSRHIGLHVGLYDIIDSAFVNDDFFMRHITFRLRPGQLLKEEIEKIAREKGIQAGVLVSLVGGLDRAILRMPGSAPDRQIIHVWDGPFEIVSGTGTISTDGCHIHVSLSDTEGRVIGGHLKDGCTVAFTVEVVILVFDDAVYKRVLDQETGFEELVCN